jgi:hypothetical protein
MWRKFYVLMAEADAGEGGAAGGGGEASGDQGGSGAGGAAAGDAGAGQGAAGTALAQAGAEGTQTQAVAIPEKYQVKKDDGSIDVEASSLKLAEAYGHLEKRMGSGDLPPKSAEEYQIAVPDALKELFDPKADPLMGDFLKDAHAAGLTQKQIDLVMGKYFELAPQLIEGGKQLSADECIADLKQEWKTDDQYKAEVGKAFKAAQAFGDKDAEAIVNDYGNDPRIIRLLARVGAELGEDKSINPGGQLPGGQSVESLMQSEAYNNPKHADHSRVSTQVAAYFDNQAKAAARAGNVPIF